MSPSPSSQSAIPPGSTVLITAVNGYVASHVADQLLDLGYKVRGTVRDADRCRWVKELFDARYNRGRFELAVVPDFNVEGAFDEALDGTLCSMMTPFKSTLIFSPVVACVVEDVSAVAHIASNLSYSTDPKEVITPTVNSTHNILTAASRHPSVKRFVYTSSAITTTFPLIDTPLHITAETWNEEAREKAWAPTFDDETERKWAVYAQSKVEAERECWRFVEEMRQNSKGEGEGFELNVVLPSACFGPSFGEKQESPTLKNIRALIRADMEGAEKGLSPCELFVQTSHIDCRIHRFCMACGRLVRGRPRYRPSPRSRTHQPFSQIGASLRILENIQLESNPRHISTCVPRSSMGRLPCGNSERSHDASGVSSTGCGALEGAR